MQMLAPASPLAFTPHLPDLDAPSNTNPRGSRPFPEPPQTPVLPPHCSAAPQGNPSGGVWGLRPSRDQPWHNPSHFPPPLSLFIHLNPSPGIPSPVVWRWESSGVLCVGWRPPSRGPQWGEGLLGGIKSFWGAGGAPGDAPAGSTTRQTPSLFHVSNCN